MSKKLTLKEYAWGLLEPHAKEFGLSDEFINHAKGLDVYDLFRSSKSNTFSALFNSLFDWDNSLGYNTCDKFYEYLLSEFSEEQYKIKSYKEYCKEYDEAQNKIVLDDGFYEISKSIADMLTEKDKRYGNSAHKPLNIFAKHFGYGSRLDEKLARVQNSDELRKNDVADIIGGLILECKRRGWTNFDDLID